MISLRSIILAARPKTLPASIVPVCAGCIVLYKFEQAYPDSGVHLNTLLAVFTALSAICLQIASNFFNDALDFLHKSDTARRQGPIRITASGQMSHASVRLWGCLFLFAAALFSVPLIQAQGLAVIAIGIPCMLCAYAYTGGPYPLSYHALGELFVLLFYGLVAVVGTIFVQLGWRSEFTGVYAAGFMMGIICGLLSCVLIEINNIRDREEDSTTGKRTLAVRLGDRRARGLALAFLIAPYAVIRHLAAILPGISWNWAWIPALIIGGILLHKITRTPADKRMNPMLGLASLHMILYILALNL